MQSSKSIAVYRSCNAQTHLKQNKKKLLTNISQSFSLIAVTLTVSNIGTSSTTLQLTIDPSNIPTCNLIE